MFLIKKGIFWSGLFFSYLTLLLPLSWADDLYRFTMPVTGSTQELRDAAILVGLEAIIVRVTGERRSLNNQLVINALKQPTRYLDDFSYTRVRRTSAPVVLHKAADFELIAGSRLLIRMNFQAKAVNRLLELASLPVWPAPRPEIAIWVVLTEQGESKLMGRQNAGDIPAILKQNTQLRGLGIRLLGEATTLLPGDIIRGDEDMLALALPSPRPRHLVTVHLSQQPDSSWRGLWYYFSAGLPRETFRTQGTNQVLNLADGVAQLAEKMAQRYAIYFRQGLERIQVHLSGIEDFENYAQSTYYLSNLLTVEKLNMLKLDQDQALFEVLSRTDKASFRRLLDASEWFEPVSPSSTQADALTTDDEIVEVGDEVEDFAKDEIDTESLFQGLFSTSLELLPDQQPEELSQEVDEAPEETLNNETDEELRYRLVSSAPEEDGADEEVQ